MRHTFLEPHEEREIKVGDLVRSGSQPGIINIVLEIFTKGTERHMRSVRYGKVNGGDFLLMHGKRSRWVNITKRAWHRWTVVEEYVPADNKALLEGILKSMEGVDTTWRPDDGVHSEEGE